VRGMSEVEPQVTPNYHKTLPNDSINRLQLSVGLYVRITEVGDLNRKDEVIEGVKEKFDKFDVHVAIMMD
jgi:transcription-repair coupling factor (superfamily II helicase)